MWSKIRFKITPPELNLFSNFLKLTKILHILVYDYEPTNFCIQLYFSGWQIYLLVSVIPLICTYRDQWVHFGHEWQNLHDNLVLNFLV